MVSCPDVASTAVKPVMEFTGKAFRFGKQSCRGRNESAGIDRHRVGDERAPPRSRSCFIMAPSHVRVVASLQVMRLTGESAVLPLSSEITDPGSRPSGMMGKVTPEEDLDSEPSNRSRGV